MTSADDAWGFLAVLTSPPFAKGEATRVRGLGLATGGVVVTPAHVAERAGEVTVAGASGEARGLWALRDLVVLAHPASTGSAPPLSEATEKQAVEIAVVDDIDPRPRVVGGHVMAVREDGGFVVELDGRITEDQTASGSPVVGRDGAVLGLVDAAGTDRSVDVISAAAVREALAAAPAPPVSTEELSTATRRALGYALALAADLGAPAALLLGVLRSAEDDGHETVPVQLRDAISFSGEGPLADNVSSHLGIEPPPYPMPFPEEEALRGSTLAPLLAQAAAIRARTGESRGLHRRHLLAAALDQPEREFPRDFLGVLGLGLPDLRAALRRAVATRADEPADVWDAVLRIPIVDLAGGVTGDYVDPTRPLTLADDQLGVATYVTMLAKLIADRETPVPLSVGLFGEWGSGKSTFMGLLRGEIDRLTRSGEERYAQDVVQIGFNAWHYADTHLWASLGDEIFEQLAGPTPAEEDGARRTRLREELAGRLQRRAELREQIERAEQQTARVREELRTATDGYRASARDLAEAALGVGALRAEIEKATGPLGVSDEGERTAVLAAELERTRGDTAEVRRALVGRWHWVALVVAALVAGGAGLALAGVAEGVLAGIGAAAAAGGWVVARARAGAQHLSELAEGLRSRRHDAVADEIARVERAEARERELKAQAKQAALREEELERELAEAAPGRRLYRFATERAASEAYRGQLGLVSTIRKDFEELIRLMDEWRRDPEPDAGKQPIDRIVLYIDDLDRCSTTQVVEVLQAVHLLLALDLFVVVLGVDPRWLVRSLRQEYRGMLTSGTEPPGQDPWWEATPQDYLEKIFQIPFVLPQMGPTGFDRLVRKLAAPAKAGPDAGAEAAAAREGEAAASEAAAVPDRDVAEAAGEAAAAGAVPLGTIEQEAGAEREPGRPLTDPELTMLSALAPLVTTPREAKRLVNLYRMIRSTRDLSDASRFLGDDEHAGEYQAVVILLGLLSGHARLLHDVLVAAPGDGVTGGLLHHASDEGWADFVDGLAPQGRPPANAVVGEIPEADVAAWTQLHRALEGAAELVTLDDLRPFQTWAPRIARFSFLLSPYAEDER